ncbi:glutathione S-transferase family protein [Roseomonas sp. GCM10028921]
MTGLVIWGRANSVNVQKVLWCCDELKLSFNRHDAGMNFGVVDTPEYRAMNPNGRVPTLVDGDIVLWESHAILRYLALRRIEQDPEAKSIYPDGAAVRARVDRWLDWVLSILQPAERTLFWGMVRTRPEDRDMDAIDASAKASGAAWTVLDSQLAHGRPYVEGDSLTLADIALGAYARRWFGVEVKDRPDLPRLREWYARLEERPSFQRHVAPPLT